MALLDSQGFPIPQDKLHLFVGKEVFNEEGFPKVLGSQFTPEQQNFIRQNGFKAFREKEAGQVQGDVEAARLSAIQEENPIMSAVAPYTAEAMAKEGDELDFNKSSGLDVASYIPRLATTSAGMFAEELGSDFGLRPEVDKSQEAFEDTFLKRMRNTEGLSPEDKASGAWGVVEDFGEIASRDPLNIIPAVQLPKWLTKAPAAVKAAWSKLDDIIKLKDARKAEVMAEATAKLGAEGFNNPAAERIAAEAQKAAQRVEQEFAEQISNAQNEYDALVSTSEKLKQFSRTAGSKVAGETSLEAGRQVLDNKEDFSTADVVLSGTIPLLAETGKGMKSAAVDKIQQKLKIRPNQQQRRYAPEVETLLKEGAVPLTGGRESIEESVAKKIDDINIERKNVQAGLASDYQGAVDDVIRPPELVDDVVSSSWNPDLDKILNPQDENIFQDVIDYDDLKRRQAELQNEFNTLDPSEQGYFARTEQLADEIADVNYRLNQFDADEIAEQRISYDRAKMSSGEVIDEKAGQAGLNYKLIFDRARQDVFEQVADGPLTEQQAQRIFDEIDLQEFSMNKFRTHSVEVPAGMSPNFPQGLDFQFMSETGPIKPMTKRLGKLFEQGKVNRYQQNLNPTNPRTLAGEAIWNASREPINKIEGMGETSAKYAKWLPLQKAIDASTPASSNRSFTFARLPADIMESNMFIRGLYGAGDVVQGLGRGSSPYDNVLMAVPKSAKKAVLDDEEDEK